MFRWNNKPKEIHTKHETIREFCREKNITISISLNNIKTYDEIVYYGDEVTYFQETFKSLQFMNDFKEWLISNPQKIIRSKGFHLDILFLIKYFKYPN
jgi:hypothetical protein